MGSGTAWQLEESGPVISVALIDNQTNGLRANKNFPHRCMHTLLG